jgi:hypothetical protein
VLTLITDIIELSSEGLVSKLKVNRGPPYSNADVSISLERGEQLSLTAEC